MMARLRWKTERCEGGKASYLHRLRRGNLTLATVIQGQDERWFFYGRIGPTVMINTSVPGPHQRFWTDPDDAKDVAAEWVRAEEQRARVVPAAPGGVGCTSRGGSGEEQSGSPSA